MVGTVGRVCGSGSVCGRAVRGKEMWKWVICEGGMWNGVYRDYAASGCFFFWAFV